MKKVLWLFSICLMMGFASCSSDDEGSSANIVGHWQSVSRSSIQTYLNTGEVIVSEDSPYTWLSFRLYDDGTCQFGTYNGTYKHLGNELNIYYSFDYRALQRDGETYIDRHVDETKNYTIKELSGKRMVLQYIWHGTDSEGYWEIDDTITMEKVN